MERFDRLLEEQKKAISQTDEKIASLRKFITEYEELRVRLEEMSKCFSKEALIPFSPKALVLGRFVHTNEVLIYLGGHSEHFCEASTHQALKIIDKRTERIQETIEKLEEQRRLLTDREGFTQRLANGEEPHSLLGEEENGEGSFEIREEYDPEKEKEWLEKHKKSVQKELAREREVAKEAKTSLRRVGFIGGEEVGSDSSDTSYLPDIEINHSDYPSWSLNSTFSDFSKASPADVVAYVKKENKKTKGILKNKEVSLVVESKPVHIESFDDCDEDIPRGSAPFNNLFAQVVERNVLTVSTSSLSSSAESYSQVTEHNSTDLPNPPTPMSSKRPISRFRLQHMSK